MKTPEEAALLGLSNHVIFLGPVDGILNFIAPLRSQSMKIHPTLVIVVLPTDVTENLVTIASSFERVYVVTGDGYDHFVLNAIGLKKCRHICILPKEGEEEKDPFLLDSDTIFTTRYVQQKFSEWRERGERDEPPTVQVELMHETNMKFIQPLLHFQKERYCVYCMKCGPCCHFLDKFTLATAKPPLVHPLTSSGSVFFSDTLIKMLSNVWKGPGLLDLAMAMLGVAHTATQSHSSAVLTSIDASDDIAGKTFLEAFRRLCGKKNPVVIVGLHRLASSKFGDFRFVFTSPPPDTIIQATDKLFVLVNPEGSQLADNVYAME